MQLLGNTSSHQEARTAIEGDTTKQKDEVANNIVSRNKGRSFVSILKGSRLNTQDVGMNGSKDAISIKPLPTSNVVRGNVVVDVEEKDYQKDFEELRFSIIGRLVLQKGRWCQQTRN